MPTDHSDVEKASQGVIHAHVAGQDDEEPLQALLRDVLAGARADHGADEDAHQLDHDHHPVDGDALDHEVEDREHHADQNRQGRGAGGDEHRQADDAGQEGDVEEAAAHADERGDGADEETADEGPDRAEAEGLSEEGDLGARHVELEGLDALLGEVALRLDAGFEGLGGFLGLLLAGLPLGAHAVDHEPADDEARSGRSIPGTRRT